MDLKEWLMKHPNGPYIKEVKIDGSLVMAFHSKGSHLLATKHNGTYTKEMFPLLMADFDKCIHKDHIISLGEFERKTQTYNVFDLIYYEGKDVTNLSLLERKKLLFDVYSNTEHVKIVPYTLLNSETQILEELAKAKESGQEGLNN